MEASESCPLWVASTSWNSRHAVNSPLTWTGHWQGRSYSEQLAHHVSQWLPAVREGPIPPVARADLQVLAAKLGVPRLNVVPASREPHPGLEMLRATQASSGGEGLRRNFGSHDGKPPLW